MRKQPVPACFLPLHPCYERLPDEMSGKCNIVSCFECLEWAFESLDTCACFLDNVSRCLVPGGFFLGICIDSASVLRRLSDASSSTVRDDLYELSVGPQSAWPAFGVPYSLRIAGEEESNPTSVIPTLNHSLRPSCDGGRFLVDVGLLGTMARERGLEMVDAPNMVTFFNDYNVQYEALLRSFQVYKKKNAVDSSQLAVLGLFCAVILKKEPV
eukprot:ANDGO_06429.mRNA.1 mRNA cap guanine-N7 methyltransferase 2